MRNITIFRPILREFSRCGPRRTEISGASTASSTPSSQPAATVPKEVPGLSNKVILPIGNEALGPGAKKSGDYKNPEYFAYDQASYFEAEVEMLKYRLPQPSALSS